MAEQSSDQKYSNTVLIVGAGSLIAQSLIAEISADPDVGEIVTVSRQPAVGTGLDLPKSTTHYVSDYSDGSIGEICQSLKARHGEIRRVFICNGILHAEAIKPEKRVEDIQAENLHTVFTSNAVTPMLWLKHLKSLLSRKQECVVTVFSARIGSIEDNNRGGWYAYRASKAALNMFIKTAAVEYARSAKGVRFLVFHPGTTDTPLSKPFQKFVDEDKLFTPDFVAQQLLGIVSRVADGEGESNINFLDWQGKKIPW